MSDIVFILGAGASKQAGAPLMNEFIDTAESMLRSDNCGHDKPAFELVFKAITALQPVYAKALIDTNNLEAVFAAFEMAKLFGQLNGLERSEVEALPGAIRRLIVRTLEWTIQFPVSGTRILAPQPYDQFCQLLNTITQSRAVRPMSASVLTFNYDLAIDYGLHSNGIVANYGLDPDFREGRVDLLKLHGSLNWRTCENCHRVVPWTFRQFFETHSVNTLLEPQSVRLDVGQRLTGFVHCPNMPPPHVAEPVIVPPTWSKTAHYDAIAPVWRRAATHLAEARDIIVIGYSLPLTDEFFRYLYALGSVGHRRLRRFWVIDSDQSGDVRQRFEQLLGPLARNRFVYHGETFENFFSRLADTFQAEILHGTVL